MTNGMVIEMGFCKKCWITKSRGDPEYTTTLYESKTCQRCGCELKEGD